MLSWLFRVISFLTNTLFDFLLFIVVDSVVFRLVLKFARTRELKRTIWLLESVLFFVICLWNLFFNHHLSILLGISSIYCFLETQLALSVTSHVRPYWTWLCAKVDDICQLADNLAARQTISAPPLFPQYQFDNRSLPRLGPNDIVTQVQPFTQFDPSASANSVQQFISWSKQEQAGPPPVATVRDGRMTAGVPTLASSLPNTLPVPAVPVTVTGPVLCLPTSISQQQQKFSVAAPQQALRRRPLHKDSSVAGAADIFKKRGLTRPLALSPLFADQQTTRSPSKPLDQSKQAEFSDTELDDVEMSDIASQNRSQNSNQPAGGKSSTKESGLFGGMLNRAYSKTLLSAMTGAGHFIDSATSYLLSSKTLVPIGFVATRNSCFVNSVLQCVSRTPNLSKVIMLELDRRLERQAHTTNQQSLLPGCSNRPLGTLNDSELRVSLMVEFSRLLQVMSRRKQLMTENRPVTLNEDKLRTYDLAALRHHLRAHRDFRQLLSALTDEQRQQDASEFLNRVVDLLTHLTVESDKPDADGPGVRANQIAAASANEHLPQFKSPLLQQYNGFKQLPAIDPLLKSVAFDIEKQLNSAESSSETELVEALAEIHWLKNYLGNFSPIYPLITGQQVDIVFCSKCSYCSANFQPLTQLMIPIANLPVAHNRGVTAPYNNSYRLQDFIRCIVQKEHTEIPLQCKCCAPVDGGTSLSSAENSRKKGNVSIDQQPLQSTPDGTNVTLSDSALNLVSPISSAEKTRAASQSYLVSQPSVKPFNQGKDSTPPETPKITIKSVRSNSLTGYKKTLFSHLPPSLVLCLKRFIYNKQTGTASKLSTPIEIPLTGLNLNDLMLDGSGCYRNEQLTTYDLYALILHIGESLNIGHYVALCRQTDNEWYVLDDSRVTKIDDIEKELTKRSVLSNAYLLFYHNRQNTNTL